MFEYISHYEIYKTENKGLNSTYNYSSDNSIKRRSHCLHLSHAERTIIEMASIDVNLSTIERWLDNLSKTGVVSLPMLHSRGVRTRLVGCEEVVTKQLEVHNRNLKNVLEYLDKEHNIKICLKTLQNFLKGTGL